MKYLKKILLLAVIICFATPCFAGGKGNLWLVVGIPFVLVTFLGTLIIGFIIKETFQTSRYKYPNLVAFGPAVIISFAAFLIILKLFLV